MLYIPHSAKFQVCQIGLKAYFEDLIFENLHCLPLVPH